MLTYGFTGSRDGLSPAQTVFFAQLFAQPFSVLVSHGDCLGSDADAHELARSTGLYVWIHPPENSSLRAFCSGALIVEHPLPYLERNQNIVNTNLLLLAAPSSEDEVIRSGTWSTVRYAKRQGKAVLVVTPSGRVLRHGPLTEVEQEICKLVARRDVT